MKPGVTIVDYGVGNLLSVARALEHCGANVALERSPDLIAHAERLVLPGVGAFRDGMAELDRLNLSEALRNFAAGGRPMLGICLGMQMLLEGSDEFGMSAGLGLVKGWVRKLPVQDGLKLPHIGWSAICPPLGRTWKNTPLEDIAPGQDMYFVHSFFADLLYQDDCLAQSQYGSHDFCSVLRSRNIVGCQFHPEKSGEVGLAMLKSFLK